MNSGDSEPSQLRTMPPSRPNNLIRRLAGLHFWRKGTSASLGRVDWGSEAFDWSLPVRGRNGGVCLAFVGRRDSTQPYTSANLTQQIAVAAFELSRWNSLRPVEET